MAYRRCIVCGEQYEFCPNCGSAEKAKATWKTIYHDEKCMEISMTMRKLRGMEISEEEAKRIIKKYPANLAAILENDKSLLAKEIQELYYSDKKENISVEPPVKETVEFDEEEDLEVEKENIKVEEPKVSEAEQPKEIEVKKSINTNKSTKYSKNKNYNKGQ